MLVVVLLVYLGVWASGHRAYLFDPMFQSDDARTHLTQFIQFGANSALASDPVLLEMRAMMPVGVWLLYRVLTPFTGLLAAAKIVQGLALIIVLVAGAHLARARHAGLAAGVLLVFLILRSPHLLHAAAGGLPRSFAPGLLALWIAGAMARSERIRFTSALLAGMLYPMVMALLLGAELLLIGAQSETWRAARSRLKRYALLVACALFLVGLHSAMTGDPGMAVSLAEARESRAFGPQGRLQEESGLPFPDPAEEAGRHLVSPLHAGGTALWSRLGDLYRACGSAAPLAVVALVALLVWLRVAPLPRASAALLLAGLVLYVLARAFAFRLYAPQRYMSLGLPLATVAFSVGAVGLVAPRLAASRRQIVRNVAAATLMLLLWAAAGDGIHAPPGDGMELHGGAYPATLATPPNLRVTGLYQALHALPLEARIAAHPMDGDDITLWGERAATPSYETLQPWFAGSWRRLSAYTEEVLRALYATDRREILDFFDRRGVTHLLLNRYRYGAYYRRNARLFEPFGSYVRKLLQSTPREQLKLASVPSAAVVWRSGPYQLVDAGRLAAAWGLDQRL
jgi:hypothetical protein